MNGTNSAEAADFANLGELAHFRNIRWLRNHWSRPIGPRTYYWYLTFEKCPKLHSVARECQEAIAFPYYDLIAPRELHLTLDRIAFGDDIRLDQLHAIESEAIRACRKISPFDITVGSLGGTRGAIGFTAFPAQPIRDLRSTLRRATLSVYPNAPVKNTEISPHVTIAYANSDDIPATEAIAAVEKLNATARVNVTIEYATLVLLERRQRSYAWEVISRIPLDSRPLLLPVQPPGTRKLAHVRDSRAVADDLR
jgi:2'-5' RNA ligase